MFGKVSFALALASIAQAFKINSDNGGDGTLSQLLAELDADKETQEEQAFAEVEADADVELDADADADAEVDTNAEADENMAIIDADP